MERLAVSDHRLGLLRDIPDGAGKAFPDPAGSGTDIVVIRRGNEFFAYYNSCPHAGTPLDLMPDQFICRYSGHILCSTHGARFRIEDGLCLDGPCPGARLKAASVVVRQGILWLQTAAD